ncbi:MAG: hypothetical protein FJ148_15615 [Deltaproteobacteria bacterium]|nr:hypothetical protein [Deltaproteobacteria bacterium]
MTLALGWAIAPGVAPAFAASTAAGAPAVVAGAPGGDATPVAVRPVERVTGGAGSLEELIARFLDALRVQDTDALESLRLTRDEYVHLVIPGHVPPGEPPQRIGPEAAEYFFAVMDAKSRHFRNALVERFGGRSLELHEIGFEKGVARYAGHRAHRRAALWLREADGSLTELRTGSVVERDGRFKFASYTRD